MRIAMKVGSLCLTAMLVACGGGGGGGGSGAADPSTSSTTPVDLSGLDLYAVAQGDSRRYQITSGGSTYILQEDISTGPDAGGLYVVTQTNESTLEVTNSSYRLTSAGIYDLDPTGGALTSAAAAQIGEALMYANSLPANGAPRNQSWTGSLDQDWDGDGRNDNFFVAVEQRLLSTSQAITLGASNDTVSRSVHLRTVFTMTFRPTRVDLPEVTLAVTGDEYFLPGWGLIKGVYSAVDGRGVSLGSETRELLSGTVGGRRWIDFAPDGPTDIKRIALPHRDMVYDVARERYYASIGSTDPALANRLAVVDARSGQVSYSNPLAVTPGALALSKDGRHLYVGSMSSSEMLRLALPDFSEVDRVALPNTLPDNGTVWSGLPGQYVRAGDIEPSPSDPLVVAVQLCFAFLDAPEQPCGLTEAGVVLVRDMTLLSRRPASAILRIMRQGRLLFDEAGTALFELQGSRLTSGFVGIAARYSVLQDGLTTTASDVYRSSGPVPESWFGIAAGGYVFSGPAIYQADTTQEVGTLAAVGCLQASDGTRPMCLQSGLTAAQAPELRVAPLNVASRTLGAALPLFRGSYVVPERVHTGRPHQLAFSYGYSSDNNGSFQEIVLVTDDRLP